MPDEKKPRRVLTEEEKAWEEQQLKDAERDWLDREIQDRLQETQPVSKAVH